MTRQPSPKNEKPDEVLDLAGKARTGLLHEYGRFMLQNKKWWLIPIVIGLMLLAGFIMLSGSSIAPLIYALF